MANWHFRVGADALARLPEMIKANKAEILRLKAQADERMIRPPSGAPSARCKIRRRGWRDVKTALAHPACRRESCIGNSGRQPPLGRHGRRKAVLPHPLCCRCG